MADAVADTLAKSAEELRAWKQTLLTACVRWLVASFSTGPSKQDQDPDGEQDGARNHEVLMLQRFTELLVGALSQQHEDRPELGE